ncbi:MAG TPA: alanine racemase [Actinocrinis sp.]|nr:alanine racemase [Actinocrinis sp.]
MPLTLYVDRTAWERQHRRLIAQYPGVVPVAKGNGYGFTVPVLAEAAARLPVDQLAIGTLAEAASVLALFPGDLLVLEPYQEEVRERRAARCGQDDGIADLLRRGGDRIVRTAASVDGVRKLAGQRLVLDCRSSLRRHGVTRDQLPDVAAALGGQELEGCSLHLPLDRIGRADPVGEAASWVRALQANGLAVPVMYVSHLRDEDLDALARACPGVRFRPRIGTRLWLGDTAAVQARATVLESFPVARGERVGYRQRRSPQPGWVLVVSGGTVQGVGLEAPRTMRGLGPRLRELARSGLAAANRTRSPFLWQGRKQWFAEPPHMLVSMLYLPRQCRPPEPGEEIPAELRHTSTHFDQVVIR